MKPGPEKQDQPPPGIRQKLRDRLEREGMRPSRRMGQNFLIDSNLLGFIAGSADLEAGDIVLEVGPGSGLLTKRLAAAGCRVLGVELDRGLIRIAAEEIAAFPNVSLIQGDILAGKRGLNPEATARLEEFIERSESGEKARPKPTGRLKCVSNLPYSAGTPFIMNMLSSPLPWRLGVFLLQLEVAERLAAAPGEAGYGSISVGAALAARISILRRAPPDVFWPAPRVESAVVRLDFKPAKERLSIPWDRLHALLAAVFGARRKTLRNALKGLAKGGRESEILARTGLDPGLRGERLRPDEFLRLAEEIQQEAIV